MAKSKFERKIIESQGGINLDTDAMNQPKATRRFTLNGVEETTDGKKFIIANEPSNIQTDTFPAGYIKIGDAYIDDDTIFCILTNPTTGKTDLGLLDKAGKYTTLVNTNTLGEKITNQCDVIYRLRTGNQRTFYWTNGYTLPHTVSIDRLYNYYNETYRDYLINGGNPNTFVGEKWDGNAFNLIKNFTSIPTFNNVEILENGNILPGSYNFGIQYIDEDLNPTNWITTSNPINIYNDSTTNPFERIRGSRNVQTDSQSFPRANKSIKLTMGNLDTSFPYYRIAIIRAAGNNGQPDKVLASDLFSTSDSNFIYTGNDANLSEVAIESILIDNEVIFAPKHITQLENRLILANTKGKGINWCDFQAYASKIKTDLTTKQVILNSVLSEPNVKNAKSTFIWRGYMPGEVYSFGIVYVFNDGYISPVFHIPGKTEASDTDMKFHEIENKYLDIHNCGNNNYWGRDASGKTLTGKNIRHQRFPFRHEVNKPLVTATNSNVNITKYKLTVVITLNPDFTPTPSYPVDGDNNPIVINYKFSYKVSTLGSNSNITGSITDTDVSIPRVITLYDDSIALDIISGGEYGELGTSELSSYQDGMNDRFIISYNYAPYVLATVYNSDVSEIFGIELSNIEKPHPDVIGIYIVRNERTDDDKLIIDNCIVGSTTSNENYRSFGLLTPKNYYNVNNCGQTASSSKTVGFDNRSAWFFNPEFQYLQKKTSFNKLVVEGKWEETSHQMPTISNVENSPCNIGYSKGLYIEDVQAGTSYNPDANKTKDKDDDGFDLLIGYRNTNMRFSSTTPAFPTFTKVIHLNAASYQNYNDKTYYNVSVDSKIGMIVTDSDIATNTLHQTSDNTNDFIYAAMVRDNPSSYSNFINKPFYKEHNNPFFFGTNNVINGVEVFNGDAQISATNIVSTVFYDMVVADRPKKNRIWQIVVGAVLVIAAVALTIVTGGLGAPLAIVAISSLAISLGVSLAVSGIKFEQFKAMIDVDYEKGLKDTVTDGGVFETIRDTVELADDTIRWFSDRVSNIYMESSIPFGLRSGLTCGVPDFVDAPVAFDELGFRSYLTEKLTTIDRDQGSGRLYKGYASAEVYDINLDYMRFNKQKEFIHLPIEYDCCTENNEVYPLRRWFSEQSFQEELTDNYRVFLPNNYSDMEGEHGEITDLYRLGKNLFVQTKEALWQQPANLQERTTNEIVSFIGTGSFFAIPPQKVVDDDLGSAGSQHKWATIKTKFGVISISEIEHKVHLHGEGLKTISNDGLESYFKENLKSFLSKQLYDNFGVEFPYINNPANPNGTGYHSGFDSYYNRVLITKIDYLILPDKLAALTIVTSKPKKDIGFVYDAITGIFYQGTTQVNLTNILYFENKSFTISYSFNRQREGWCSWHSYIPNTYLYCQNSLFHTLINSNSIRRQNQRGTYQVFSDIYYPFIVEIVKTGQLEDFIFEDLMLQTEARRYSAADREFINERLITFNKIVAYNNRQISGELDMITKSETSEFFLFESVNNPANSIIVAKVGDNWCLNGLRDRRINNTKAIFTSSWSLLKSEFFIDKVPNPSSYDAAKDWFSLESFKGKYLIFRLKFDNFDNNDVNLILNYSLETEQPTE